MEIDILMLAINDILRACAMLEIAFAQALFYKKLEDYIELIIKKYNVIIFIGNNLENN